jgi:hypothetical protein
VKKQEIRYYWGDDSLTIEMGNRTGFRIRALYLVEFMVTSGMATLFLLQGLSFGNAPLRLIAGIGAASLYILAAHRLLSRLFFRETVKLDNLSITFVRRTLLSKHVHRYFWWQTGMLHYEGQKEKTDHPLKGGCYDYFGFETQERLVQNLHNPGNLYFDTPEGRVYFAAGVYSWDAEEMVQMMKLFIGPSIRLGPEWAQMLEPQDSDEFWADR